MSLFWRIFLLNAVVLCAATVLLLLGPITVSTPVLITEVLILAGGLAVMLVANAVLFRIGLAPLQRLTRTMTTTELLRPVPRPLVTGHSELAGLISAFNNMLDRLEAERSDSAARALSAQEAERSRIGRELHDEVGQTLTAVLLNLKRLADSAPQHIREELSQVQETTRDSLDEIRRIARRLRPGVLEELGLLSALKALATEAADHTGLAVHRHLDHDLPQLSQEVELVVYRVAQEAITNTARHAEAGRFELVLTGSSTGVELRIQDDGRGLNGSGEGAGIRGMRERALLIGAELTLDSPPGSGTTVRLAVPTYPRSHRP